MKIVQSVRMGAWLLIGLNLLMALGCIWIFVRMTPAIEMIIERNERSLEACEEMLASLAVISHDVHGNPALRVTFLNALGHAQKNITEKDEPAALESIRAHYTDAFLGNSDSREKTVAAIIRLGKINRAAMIVADRRARQFGNAGAWGVVFMAVNVFFAGMLFKRTVSRNLVAPLEEIHGVISAHQTGDAMRRCSGPDVRGDVKLIYEGINDLLDRCRFQSTSGNRLLGRVEDRIVPPFSI